MKNPKIKLIPKLLFICILMASCCSDDDSSTTEKELPIISNFNVEDLANEGNSTDLKITFELVGDIASVKTSKLVISKASRPLKTTEVSKLTENQFKVFSPETSITMQLEKILNDTNGDLIQEDIDYTAYVVLSNDEQMVLGATAKSFQLKNETIVTTLVRNIEANEDISLDANLNLYVNSGGDFNVNPTKPYTNIFKITPEGNVSVFNDTVSYPVGNTFDNNANLLVTQFGTNIIYKIAPDGTKTELVNDSRFFGGGGIVVLNDGTILNTFAALKKIYKIEPNGTISELLSDNRLRAPVGMTYDKENNKVYVGNFNNGKIFRIENDNTLSEIADTPASIGHMSYANQHFYLTGFRQHKIYKVALDGTIVEEIGTGLQGALDGSDETATFKNPNGIEATPNGKIVYITGANSKIRKIIMKR